MKIINKDITTIKKGIIGHQVNLQGKMGAGLALQIRNKWPKVYDRYIDWVRETSLGRVLLVPVDTNLYVANLAGQDFYGSREQDTDYQALEEALNRIGHYCRVQNDQLYLPYNLGSCRGGGDWRVVKKLIEKTCPKAILCKL